MPRVVPKKHPFTAEEVVVAWQAFAFDDADGRQFTIPRGARLRGDHPAVLGCPAYFAKEGVPADEVPNMWDHVGEAPQPEAEFYHPAPPIPDSEAVVAQVDILMTQSGRSIKKGQKYHRDDPLVKSNPEFFAVITPLA